MLNMRRGEDGGGKENRVSVLESCVVMEEKNGRGEIRVQMKKGGAFGPTDCTYKFWIMRNIVSKE